MAKRIVCFGDSNTYGYDPRGPLGDRYPPWDRWPNILEETAGDFVINAGQNGRTIPYMKYEVHAALNRIGADSAPDILIVMLGSNDVLTVSGPNPQRVGGRMERFIAELKENLVNTKILLVAPPKVEIPLAHIQQAIRDLPPIYKAIAETHNIQFASALDWDLSLSVDGVHLTPEAHHVFAAEIAKILST